MKMQRAFLVLSVLVAGALITAGTCTVAASSAPAPIATALVGNARMGEATFTQYCSICHSAGGKGFIGPHIGGINWTVPGLHTIVRGGLGGYGGMPAFNADVVTDRNIADIAAYLASLAAPTSARLPAETPAVAVASQAPIASPAPVAAVASSTTAAPASPAVPAAAVAPPPQAAAVAGGDPVHGRSIFTANCAACHGASGQGGFGPSLRGERTRKGSAAAISWIKDPKPPMPKLYPDPLSAKDVEDVTAYIESL